LLHAAGELGGEGVVGVGEAEGSELVAAAVLCLGRVDAADPQSEGRVLQGAQLRDQRGCLRDVDDLPRGELQIDRSARGVE